MSKNFEKVRGSEQKLLAEAMDMITAQMSSPELTKTFLNKVMTEKERLNIARRLLIASMVQRGETYMAINEKLQVSPNTFTQIKKWLETELPDYNSAIEHTNKAKRKRQLKTNKNDTGAPLTLGRLKKQYPLHFLLFNLAETLLNK